MRNKDGGVDEWIWRPKSYFLSTNDSNSPRTPRQYNFAPKPFTSHIPNLPDLINLPPHHKLHYGLPLMILSISPTSLTAVVKFSNPVSVTKILSSILTPPTSQYFSSTSASIYLECAGSLRYGSMMKWQK
jgi:hypothetical protein